MLRIYYNLLMHFPVSGHLDFFPLGAIKKKNVLKIILQGFVYWLLCFLWTYSFILLIKISEMET